MERVRVTELLAAASAKRRRKVTQKELAEYVFANDIGKPLNGVAVPLSSIRKNKRLWDWKHGREMASMKPRHLLRMAEFFKVYDVRKLMEAKATVNNEEGA